MWVQAISAEAQITLRALLERFVLDEFDKTCFAAANGGC